MVTSGHSTVRKRVWPWHVSDDVNKYQVVEDKSVTKNDQLLDWEINKKEVSLRLKENREQRTALFTTKIVKCMSLACA